MSPIWLYGVGEEAEGFYGEDLQYWLSIIKDCRTILAPSYGTVCSSYFHLPRDPTHSIQQDSTRLIIVTGAELLIHHSILIFLFPARSNSTPLPFCPRAVVKQIKQRSQRKLELVGRKLWWLQGEGEVLFNRDWTFLRTGTKIVHCCQLLSIIQSVDLMAMTVMMMMVTMMMLFFISWWCWCQPITLFLNYQDEMYKQIVRVF